MTATKKPRAVLLSSASAGVCHWCLGIPRYLVLGRQHLRCKGLGEVKPERNVILRVCPAHLVFMQSSERTPIELLAIDGHASPLDVPTAAGYMPKKYTPDITASPLLLGG